jgi:hypothetical protein
VPTLLRWITGTALAGTVLVGLLFGVSAYSMFPPPPKATLSADITATPITQAVFTVYVPAVRSGPDQHLVHALATRFRRSEATIQTVVDAANQFASKDFPRKEDILAIVAVESSFDHYARGKGSWGLMQIQINYHLDQAKDLDPWAISDNVSLGADILHSYYCSLHRDRRRAVLAYNVGVHAVKRHKARPAYYKKYRRELAYITSIPKH